MDTKRITQKFLSARQYRLLLGDRWDITVEEWTEFLRTFDRAAEFLAPHSRLAMRRINATKPWTIDNVEVLAKQPRIPKPRKVPVRAARPEPKPRPSEDGHIVLTPRQWQVELRAEKSASDNK